MKANESRFRAGVLGVALTATLLAPALSAAPSVDPEADRIFKAACQYLSDAKSFGVKVEVWKDLVLPSGQKLQITRALEVQEQRPGRLHIEEHSSRGDRGFWYQDKSLVMLDRTMNLYGVMEVPATLDQAMDVVEERFGIEIPLGDVLVSDPYHNVMDGVETADNLGKVTLLGVVCDHLAFTSPNADCQIWIADGGRPLLKKMVIRFKNETGAPEVTQLFSDWDLVNPISESVFAFTPPEGAEKVVVDPNKPEAAAEDTAPEKK